MGLAVKTLVAFVSHCGLSIMEGEKSLEIHAEVLSGAGRKGHALTCYKGQLPVVHRPCCLSGTAGLGWHQVYWSRRCGRHSRVYREPTRRKRGRARLANFSSVSYRPGVGADSAKYIPSTHMVDDRATGPQGHGRQLEVHAYIP
ncbi:hypothetical protein B0T25DRAFT_541885 [Lasiosphaeria hispida]|uniref:Uncharacterized protein n=1 Tax=Lasiosphaeria hispida TaxID=260671 RepID=A0AAJ0HHB6_9PEZI|nr:hypothetical protein B0T25DRAFT_541885 [Lasiosphaeria hispida]